MKNLSLHIVLVLTCFGGAVAQTSAARYDVRVSATVVIGDDEDRGLEYLLARPVSVCDGPEGSIFVADRVSMNVRQFSKNGEYIRTIGARGRGPGEFTQLVQVYSSEDQKRLFVLDGSNRRLTVFDANDGRLLDTHPFDLYNGNPKVDTLPDGRHVLVYTAGRTRTGDHELPSLVVFDPTGSMSPEIKYTIPGSVWDADERVRHMLGANPGSILARKNGTILFAPRLYDGRIFEINAGAELGLRRVIVGTLKADEVYEKAPPPDVGNPDFGYRPVVLGDMEYFRFPCESQSLFEYGNFFGHVAYCEVDGRREHTIEFFDETGSSIGVGILRTWEVEDDGPSPIRIGSIDSELRAFGYRYTTGGSVVAFISQLRPEGELARMLNSRR